MLIWLSCVLAGLSLYCIVWVALHPARNSPAVPPHIQHRFLRLAWPWLEALARMVTVWLSWKLRHTLILLVQRAGLDPAWRPEHLVALQLLSGMLAMGACTAFGFLVVSLPLGQTATLAGGAGLVAAWLPRRKLSDRGAKRRLLMQHEFPFLLDMATLCVEAGLSLQGALQEAARHGPAGPLRDELRRALMDMQAGIMRQEALQQLARRTGMAEVQQLVTALSQADQLGMALGPLLRSQSEQRRNERFMRAEKLALEAPVKMLFPLVCCIFPCTFLIIGFPIAVKLLEAI